MRKVILYAASFCIALGIAGVGGAVDLAESPKRALLVLFIGLVLLLVGFRKGVTSEEDTKHCSCHNASYPSYLDRR